jgi:hypothetical protein
MEQIWESLGPYVIGALIPIVLATLFWRPLARLIGRSSDLEVDWGDLKIRLKGGQAEQMLESLFQEMRALIDSVPSPERQRVLKRIEFEEGRIRVQDIYPNFKRETLEHNYLRSLRDAQFIRPFSRGRFHPDSLLQLKQFGRLMLRYQRVYILGADSVPERSSQHEEPP